MTRFALCGCGGFTLGMERANSVEGTLRWQAGGFEFEGAAWAARFNNYIYGALTGLACDEAGVPEFGALGPGGAALCMAVVLAAALRRRRY